MVDLEDLLDVVTDIEIANDSNLGLEPGEKRLNHQSLYSKRAIFWLSFLCSIVLGLVLLCINLGKIKKKRVMLYAIVITLSFIAIELAFNPIHNPVSGIGYWIMNLMGALLMRF